MANRDALCEAFTKQGGIWGFLGSDLYEKLAGAAAKEVLRNGALAELLEAWLARQAVVGDLSPGKSLSLPVRLMAGVHFCVLRGEEPSLARFYPSVGGCIGDPEDMWRAFEAVVERRHAFLLDFLDHFPQTNDPRRSASLLGGFLQITAETNLPLRLREIGASAGLNLQWDRYRYELGAHRWGPSAASVVLRADWERKPGRFDACVEVESRSGCDVHPLEISRPEIALRLRSYVWADQVEHLRTLEGAIAMSATERPRLDAQSAASWLRSELQVENPGLATVVFHSAVWPYIGEQERSEILALLEEAGSSCGPKSALAWLRLEDREDLSFQELRLRMWPGRDRLLATVNPRSRSIRWVLE